MCCWRGLGGWLGRESEVVVVLVEGGVFDTQMVDGLKR